MKNALQKRKKTPEKNSIKTLKNSSFENLTVTKNTRRNCQKKKEHLAEKKNIIPEKRETKQKKIKKRPENAKKTPYFENLKEIKNNKKTKKNALKILRKKNVYFLEKKN